MSPGIPWFPTTAPSGSATSPPIPGLLAEYAAAPERRDWWLDRLRRVHAVLAAPAR